MPAEEPMASIAPPDRIMAPPAPRATWNVYAGLAMTALTTLAYQLLLTRIFSVTLWYHYTFMAISVTMFGLTLGATLVYLRPGWFPPAAAARQMGVAAAAFAVLLVVVLLVHVRVRLMPVFELDGPWLKPAGIAAYYLFLTLPFAASGVAVTLALTRFPEQSGTLYAADLIGAGLGCLLVAGLSSWIDAPNLVLLVAMLAAWGAVVCQLDRGWRPLRGWRVAGGSGPTVAQGLTLSILLVLSGLVCFQHTPAGRRAQLVRLRWAKGTIEEPPLFERWNAHSRVAVWPGGSQPAGWGFSSRMPSCPPVRQWWLNIDASAGSVMTEFHGDLAAVEYLRYDVTNFVHYLRPRSRLLVMGAGGGRDVLSALYFRQPQVVAVEVNAAILEALNGRFGEQTGHLDRRPGVTFVHDDARAFLAREAPPFDIIQASLLDTWAATPAAYVLAENSLYTLEAWDLMLSRLTDRGVITFSRWYTARGPSELYRLTALATAALQRRNVQDPRKHLLVVCRPHDSKSPQPTGVATLLLSRSAFSEADIETAHRVAGELGFPVLLSPRMAADPTLARVASGGLDELSRNSPIDLSPPTDDRPFFFDMIRPGDVLSFLHTEDPSLKANVEAAAVLGVLLATVLTLAGLGVLVPLALSVRRLPPRDALPFFVYFASIGLGFMLVEVGMFQRLSIFLGHPIHSITVVLCSLLVASGVGSWLSGGIVRQPLHGRAAGRCLAVLTVVVLAVGLMASPILDQCNTASTPLRIAVAIALLVPLGLVMGMGFPIGMRAASSWPAWTPWWFGINGAASVCGSVLAMVISLSLGIRATLLVGAACYGLAWLSLAAARGLAGIAANVRHGRS